MVGNRLSRHGTLSACSCGFKDLPCSCHVARQWDRRRPKSLEWHLWSRWGLLYGRTLHRWRCSQAQCVTKRSNFSWFWLIQLESECDRLLATCVGYYDLPDGIVLSVPITFMDGKWSVLFDVTVGEELKERLHLSASELRQVRNKGYSSIHFHSDNMLLLLKHMVFQKCLLKKRCKAVFFFPPGKRTWIIKLQESYE